MLSADRRNLIRTLLSLAALTLALVLAIFFLIVWAAPSASAQGVKQAALARKEGEPIYREYRGVHLGSTAEEVRTKLCKAVSESEQEDFHVVSETETAQVYYDAAHKVRAIVVMYISDGPTAEAVLGRAAETKSDGSQHLLIRYERAGYWVAYTRTAGDAPVVTIAMQVIVK